MPRSHGAAAQEPLRERNAADPRDLRARYVLGCALLRAGAGDPRQAFVDGNGQQLVGAGELDYVEHALGWCAPPETARALRALLD